MAVLLMSCQTHADKGKSGKKAASAGDDVAMVQAAPAQIPAPKASPSPNANAGWGRWGWIAKIGEESEASGASPLLPPKFVFRRGAEAGIPDDKMGKLRQDYFDTEERLVDLDGKVRKARIELQRQMASGDTDEAKLFAQMDELSRAEAEVRKQQAGFVFRMAQSLSPEQRKKLEELRHPSQNKKKTPAAN
jgi:uncharacterized membrane protein